MFAPAHVGDGKPNRLYIVERQIFQSMKSAKKPEVRVRGTVSREAQPLKFRQATEVAHRRWGNVGFSCK